MRPLKRLSHEGVAAALKKAEHYRLLNEPRTAESICLDVLEIEPDNQRALVLLLLARTDQFRRDTAGTRVEDVRKLLAGLAGEYDRAYYAGIVCERWAKAVLSRTHPGAGSTAYEWFHEAMGWYEKAEKLRPRGDDDPILRWNACARLIEQHGLKPAHDDDFHPLLE